MLVAMTRLTKEQFVAQLRGQEIDVSDARRAEGLAPVDVTRADRDGDGVLAGEAEHRALFHEIDRLDRNGSYASIRAEDDGGHPTRAGRAAAEALGLARPAAGGPETLTREAFADRFGDLELDVEQARRDAALRGVDVRAADANRDGVIRGQGEAEALFREIDHLDRNGRYASIQSRDRRGRATRAGAAADAALERARPRRRFTVEAPTPRPPVKPEGAVMGAAGAASMREATEGHVASIEATGVGRYYGNQSRYAAAAADAREAYLERTLKPGAEAPELEQSSCIEYAMEHVGAAYRAAGKGERWAEIRRDVIAGGAKGTDLAQELQKDGWEAVYFNPDTQTPHDGDSEHPYTARLVERGRPYYGIDVDHQVTDYRPTAGSDTEKDLSGVERLEEAPFFFGLARGGQHTFVGAGDTVNEFHWDAEPHDRDAIEERELEDFPWLSGVLMVPPGTWPDGP
jgi:hypothetical protein